MEFEIDFNQENQSTVLRVRGEVDVSATVALREQLSVLISKGEPVVEVDLSEVTFLDSSGVGMLVRTWKMLDGQGSF